MTDEYKKTVELSILRQVYGKKRYPRYVLSEKPDFILERGIRFGVEVTEYFPDETIARLHKFPSYTDKIIDKTYIHKDDISKLEVVEFEYQNKKNGKWKKLSQPGVKQADMIVTDKLALLVKRVNHKSRAFFNYNDTLAFIDLLICDSRNTLLNGTNDQFVRQTLNNFRLNGLFKLSGYRNIVIIFPATSDRIKEIVYLK